MLEGKKRGRRDEGEERSRGEKEGVSLSLG